MKRKNEGITLIALIITVIVLIILASVTISLVVGDNGIITKAKEAKQNMTNASAEEEELLQNLLNEIKGIEDGKIDIPEGTIEFGEVTWSNGQAEVIIIAKVEGKTLQYQVNGKTEKNWQEIENGEKITELKHGDEVHARLWDGKNVSTIKTKRIEDTKAPEVSIKVGKVTDSSIEVTVQAIENESGLLDVETYEYCIGEGEALDGKTTTTTFTYDELTPETEYKLTVKVRDKAGNEGKASIKQRTDKVQLPTIEAILKEGDYVLYEDEFGTQQKCMVLYGPENEKYSSYGIQIITAKTEDSTGIVGNVRLGTLSDFNGNREIYNSAITILNAEADKYRKKEDGIAELARCVGSVPDNPNYDGPGMFTLEPSYNTNGYFTNYNGTFKDKDDNYIMDWEQMKKLEIDNISIAYWVASRNVYYHSSSVVSACYFFIRSINEYRIFKWRYGTVFYKSCNFRRI